MYVGHKNTTLNDKINPRSWHPHFNFVLTTLLTLYRLQGETNGGNACGSLLLQCEECLWMADEDLRLPVLHVVLEVFLVDDHSHSLLVRATVEVRPRLLRHHLVPGHNEENKLSIFHIQSVK